MNTIQGSGPQPSRIPHPVSTSENPDPAVQKVISRPSSPDTSVKLSPIDASLADYNEMARARLLRNSQTSNENNNFTYESITANPSEIIQFIQQKEYEADLKEAQLISLAPSSNQVALTRELSLLRQEIQVLKAMVKITFPTSVANMIYQPIVEPAVSPKEKAEQFLDDVDKEHDRVKSDIESLKLKEKSRHSVRRESEKRLPVLLHQSKLLLSRENLSKNPNLINVFIRKVELAVQKKESLHLTDQNLKEASQLLQIFNEIKKIYSV